MKNISTGYSAVFLMIVLTCSAPFLSYAQHVPKGAKETTTSEQGMNPESELVATAVADAKRDVNVDFSNYDGFLWFSVGFGCSVLGIAAAYFAEGRPPPVRLLGKSPDYVIIYGDTYRSELRKKRMLLVGSGCITSYVLLALLSSSAEAELDEACVGFNETCVGFNETCVGFNETCSGCFFLFSDISSDSSSTCHGLNGCLSQ